MAQPTDSESTPATTSVVQDGRVDTSVLGRSGKEIAGGARPSWKPPLTVGDPTQDPSWAAFQQIAAQGFPQQPPSQQQIRDNDLRTQIPPELAAMLGQGANLETPRERTQQQPAPAQTAQPSPAAQPVQGATQEAPKPTSTPADVEKRTKALAALKRDGWKDAVISKLSDAELLELGTHRHEAQVAVDAKLQERREAHREQAPASDKKPVESGATPASGPGQTAPPTFDVILKDATAGISKALSEHLGAEIGGPVSAAVENALKATVTPLLKDNQALAQVVQDMAKFLEESVGLDVTRGWETEYPDAVKPEMLAKIESTVADLASTGKYNGRKGMIEAYEHARRIHMPDVQPVSAAQRSTKQAEIQAAKAGSTLTLGQRNAATGMQGEEAQQFAGFLRAHQLSRQLTTQYGPQ